jgi:hypothetical protein
MRLRDGGDGQRAAQEEQQRTASQRRHLMMRGMAGRLGGASPIGRPQRENVGETVGSEVPPHAKWQRGDTRRCGRFVTPVSAQSLKIPVHT